jgi:hypothetical protein
VETEATSRKLADLWQESQNRIYQSENQQMGDSSQQGNTVMFSVYFPTDALFDT